MWGVALRLLPMVGNKVTLVGLVGALLGAYATHYYYSEKEQELALAHAKALAEQGQKDYAKLVKVYNELDNAKHLASSLRNDFDGLRKQQRIYEARRGSTQRMDCPTNGRCEQLLNECTGLLETGSELLLRNATRHDAVIKLLKE